MEKRSFFSKLAESPLGRAFRELGRHPRDAIVLRSGTLVGVRPTTTASTACPLAHGRPSRLSHPRHIYANCPTRQLEVEENVSSSANNPPLVEKDGHIYAEVRILPTLDADSVIFAPEPTTADEEASAKNLVETKEVNPDEDFQGTLSRCSTPSSWFVSRHSRRSALANEPQPKSINSEGIVQSPEQSRYERSEGIHTPNRPPNPILNPPRPVTSINIEGMEAFNKNDFNSMVPEFKGEPERAPIFIRRADALFSQLSVDGKEEFFRKIIFKLDGSAFDLFESRHFRDWPEFKEAIQKKYQGHKSLSDLQSELTLMRQGKEESVEDYSTRIRLIVSSINKSILAENQLEDVRNYLLQKSEVAVNRAYKEGLYGQLKTRLFSSNPALTLDELISLALTEEPFTKTVTQRNNESSQQLQVKQETLIECSKCKKKGHAAEQCYTRQRLQYCSLCKGLGHTAEICANRRLSALCSTCKKPGHTADSCYFKRKGTECTSCNQMGHSAEQCGNRPVKREVTCFNCRETGHYANECKNFDPNARNNNRVSFGNSRAEGKPTENNGRSNPKEKNSSAQTRVLSASRLEEENQSY